MLYHTALFLLVFGYPLPDIEAENDYNPTPNVPYEAITDAQEDLLKLAAGMTRGADDDARLAACAQLIQDEALPAELRRWANLHQIRLLMFNDREWEALEVGRQWLEEQPDYPHALELRLKLAEIVTQREHDAFKPTARDLRRVYADLFQHHKDADLRLIRAHMDYAEKLEFFSSVRGTKNLEMEQLEHLQAAENLVHERLKDAARVSAVEQETLTRLVEQILPRDQERVLKQLDTSPRDTQPATAPAGKNRPAE